MALLGNQKYSLVDMLQMAMIPIAITRSLELSAAAKLAFAVINARAWAPWISTVARDSALSPRALHSALKELTKHKLIEIQFDHCFRPGQNREEAETL